MNIWYLLWACRMLSMGMCSVGGRKRGGKRRARVPPPPPVSFSSSRPPCRQYIGQRLFMSHRRHSYRSFGRHADRHIFLVREEKGKRGFLCFPRTLKPRAHVSLHHTPSTLFLSQHTHSISIVRYTIHIYSLPRMRSRPRIRRPRTKKPRAPHPPLHREGAEPSAP